MEGGFLVGQIKLLNGRIINKLLAENNLLEFNGEQGKILYTLWKKDNVSITEISKSSGLALNTLTSMLDLMEKADLLYRKSSDEDKRKKIVCLSEKGKSLEAKTDLINKKMAEIFYKGFSEDEMIQIDNYLKQIVKNLMEEEEKG